MRHLWLAGLALLPACSDALDQDTTAGQVVVVVNAGSGDATVVDATRLTTTSFALAPGVPTSLDARFSTLIVALGDSDAVQATSIVGAGLVTRLAGGSGATGVAIEDDSIVWVGNPGLHTVTRVNYTSGDTTSVEVGRTPRALAIAGRRLFVLNGNLSAGTPAGPGWLLVLALPWEVGGANLRPDSIGLTGTNPTHGLLGDDGLFYVVMAGTAGAGDGRLAIVDPSTGREVAVVNGLGESPGPAAYHPSGRLLIASPTEGILEVSTARRSLVRGPGQGARPEGDGIDALVVDRRGRVYAVARRTCPGPAVLHVLSAPPDYRLIETIPLGSCPTAAVLAAVSPGP